MSAVLVGLLLTSGCSSGRTCTDIGLPGLVITVRDAESSAFVCDARVRLVDGEYVEDARGHPVACNYAGAHERQGTYRIEVQRQGYVPKVIDAIIVWQEAEERCGHVITTKIDLELEPDPSAPRDGGAD